jgi:biopolymer transport protein ExbD
MNRQNTRIGTPITIQTEFFMSQAFGASGKRRKPSINITSLIDVMFLLLIFFMVSSTFKDEEAIEITLPQAGSGAAQTLEVYEVLVSKEGQYYIDGEIVERGALAERVTVLLESDPEANIVLRGDAGADWQSIVSAIDILRNTGITNLSIPTDHSAAAPTSP